MKPRTATPRAILALTLVCALILGTGIAVAYGALTDTPGPLAISVSNPMNPSDPTSYWRRGWGMSVQPDLRLGLPSVTPDEFLEGIIYVVDRDDATVVDAAHPEWYLRSARLDGTHLDLTLDLPGTLANPPSGGWPALEPGAVQAIEGRWYFHYRFLSNWAISATQLDIPIGIDVTPPSAVTGLLANPSLWTAGDPDVWYSSTRAHITWDPAVYDALSGDAYYQVFIDDQPVIPEDGGATQGRVYSNYPLMPSPGSITIESMPPGRHKVSIAVVDRATNQGSLSDTYFSSDPDTPTISLSVPPFAGRYAQAAAVANDAGGIASVKFFVGATQVSTVTAPPYTANIDMLPFGPGPYTFSATVTDMFGRSTTAVANVVGDPTAGFMTGLFARINGFDYPGADGMSPIRYFNTRAIDVTLTSSRTVDSFAYMLSRSTASSPAMPSTAGEPPSAILPLTGIDGITGMPIAAGTLDMASWQSVQTTVPVSTVGMADPIEGVWFLTARGLLSSEFPPLSSSLRKVQFVIDVTPPTAPTGVTPLDGLLAGTWVPSARRDIRWNNAIGAGLAQYDGLSGDAYYVITLNGVEVARSRPILSSLYNYCSVENLLPGANVVGVSVVDNAGNRSAETMLTLLADTDVPTIVNTSPDWCGRFAYLTCIANDEAGISGVRYAIDGVVVGTSLAAPFSLTADMVPFGVGYHTVTATAIDMAGRTASAAKSIRVINTHAPIITGISDSPDPFYPVLRNRYKDDSIVRFKISENAMVWLLVYNSKGEKVRLVTATWRRRGRNTIKWNGLKDDGTMAPDGTYRYWVGADDAAGNVCWSRSGTTRLRSFIVRRLGGNRVRLIFK
jgi:hypothetical protein